MANTGEQEGEKKVTELETQSLLVTSGQANYHSELLCVGIHIHCVGMQEKKIVFVADVYTAGEGQQSEGAIVDTSHKETTSSQNEAESESTLTPPPRAEAQPPEEVDVQPSSKSVDTLLDGVVVTFADYQDCMDEDTMDKWKQVLSLISCIYYSIL